jgi:hypothetical protein
VKLFREKSRLFLFESDMDEIGEEKHRQMLARKTDFRHFIFH